MLPRSNRVDELLQVRLLRLGSCIPLGDPTNQFERGGDLGPADDRGMTSSHDLDVQPLYAVHVPLVFARVQHLEPGAVQAIEKLQAELPSRGIELADVVHGPRQWGREGIDGLVHAGTVVVEAPGHRRIKKGRSNRCQRTIAGTPGLAVVDPPAPL